MCMCAPVSYSDRGLEQRNKVLRRHFKRIFMSPEEMFCFGVLLRLRYMDLNNGKHNGVRSLNVKHTCVRVYVCMLA